jgi:Uma2 family endonuclease
MSEESTREIYRHLRDLAQEFQPPPGISPRFEIADGQVIMMMSPAKRHDLNALRIARQLQPQLPEELVASPIGDVENDAIGSLRRPDVIVVPEAAFLEGAEDEGLDAREILLAVEIVSKSNPDNDYRAKTLDYPRMGIEHYLIVDPRDGTCLYQWDIVVRDGRPGYRNRLASDFGEKITVRDWVIDTGKLWRYGA